MFHYIKDINSYFHYAQTRQLWKAYLNTYVKNLKKNMPILKFHPGMKCLHILFSSRDEISSVFLTGICSSRDEISSRQKRVRDISS